MAGQAIRTMHKGSGASQGSRAAEAAVTAQNEAGALLHDRIRLAVLVELASARELVFTELRDATGSTDGNLLTHLRKLEDAGLVGCAKTGAGRGGRSAFTLTAKGRSALEGHLEEMERLLERVRRK